MIISTEEQLLDEMSGDSKAVIFGSGKVGRTMLRYFRSKKLLLAGIAAKNNTGVSLFEYKTKELSDFAGHTEDYTIFLCVREEFQKEYRELAESLNFKKIRAIAYDLYVQLSVAENVHVDFLCAGFSKSGTTSLQTAFKKHPAICVPINKESYYLRWRTQFEDAPERFKNRYFPNLEEGKITGNIEPAYHDRAMDAYECFGKDLKIILMMRNPIDATYSNFKMLMKNPTTKHMVFYYLKHNKFHVDMFDNYLEDYIYNDVDMRYQYSKYVKEFIEYFGKDQVKLIFFEEIIKEPTRILDEVQEFIGAPNKKYKKLPKSNAAKFVSRNFIGAVINRYFYKKKIAMKAASVKQMKRYWKIAHFFQKYTYVENDEKLPLESRKQLRDFYAEGVHELEEIAGRSLGDIWPDFKYSGKL